MVDRDLWRVCALVGLFAVMLALYAPTLRAPFVYEDTNDVETFQDRWAGVNAQPFRAIPRLIWRWAAIEGRGEPWPYHVASIAAHALNGWLLTSLVGGWIGVFAVGVFWLHPLQVESVAYISALPDVLAVTCCLLALLAVERDRWDLALVAVVAAVFAKETAIVTYGLAWFYGWSRDRRAPRWWGGAAFVPALVLLLVLAWLGRVPTFSADYSLASVAVVTRYLAWTAWPVGLSVDHDWSWATGIVGFVCLWTWSLLWRTGWARFGVIWTALALAPRLLVPYGDGLHDHHWGIVLLGWCLALARLQGDERG